MGGDGGADAGGGFREAGDTDGPDQGGDFLAEEGGSFTPGTSTIGGDGALAGGGFFVSASGRLPGDGGGSTAGPEVPSGGAFGGGGGKTRFGGGGGVGGGGSALHGDGGYGGGGGNGGIAGIGGFGGGSGGTGYDTAGVGGGFGGGGRSANSGGPFGGSGGSTGSPSIGGGGGAGLGGAVFNHFGHVNVINATLDGNTAQGGKGGGNPANNTRGGGGGAGLGGAMFNLNGVVHIESSTLTANQSIGGAGGGVSGQSGQGVGGALFNLFYTFDPTGRTGGVGNTVPAVTTTAAATTITLEDSIIADSVGDRDCWNEDGAAGTPVVNLAGSNLIESNAAGVNACGAPSLSADPQLGPLQNNGGATFTRKPLPNSPVIDAASACPTPAVDQRELPRPVGAACDLGAVEVGSSVTISDLSQLEGSGGGNTAFVFTLNRSGDLEFPVSVIASTALGSASASDITGIGNQAINFAANASTTTLAVNVSADNIVEADETFLVNLSPGLAASPSDNQAQGTIQNDDSGPVLSLTKIVTVSGPGFVNYRLVISNTGAVAQANNAGDEFTDVLPASLSVFSATASSGTITRSGSTVTWNGSIAAGASVTIDIHTLTSTPAGTPISNQASASYDANNDSSNDTTALSDNPGTPAPHDATVIASAGPFGPIPSLSRLAQLLLIFALLNIALTRAQTRG